MWWEVETKDSKTEAEKDKYLHDILEDKGILLGDTEKGKVSNY